MLIVTLILILLLVSSELFLWSSWAKLLCTLTKQGIGEMKWSLLAFIVFWALFLAVFALLSLLVKDMKILMFTFLLAGLGLLGFLWEAGMFFPLGVVSATGLTLGLLISGCQLKNEVNNHLKFSANHLLPPRFRNLGLFLILIFSFYVFWVARGCMADFKIIIPDFMFEVISEHLPVDLGGETLGESTIDAGGLGEFLRGEAPLPEELRPYLEGGELPEEIKGLLGEHGIPADLLQSSLSAIEVDEEGKIKEPLSGGGTEMLMGGVKMMLEDQLNQYIEPYRGFLPLILAGSVFMFLFYANLLMPILGLVLAWLLLKILVWTKIVKVKIETVEAERLIVE